jgi:hypothetical protein
VLREIRLGRHPPIPNVDVYDVAPHVLLEEVQELDGRHVEVITPELRAKAKGLSGFSGSRRRRSRPGVAARAPRLSSEGGV